MIKSQLGTVIHSVMTDSLRQKCETLGINPDEVLRNTLDADLYVIFLALADEYGIEWTVETITNCTEQLIKERTKHE